MRRIVAGLALLTLASCTPDPAYATPVSLDQIVQAAAVPPKGYGAFAKCVEHRESRGDHTAVSSGGYAGLYQWSPAFQHGLPYIVRRGLVEHGYPSTAATATRVWLSRTPIRLWPAVYQRIGFGQVLREGGNAAALRHWGLSGSKCDRMLP